jgi:Arc/MetJ-type ribon-helix-helix transcriptional regulator
MRTRRQLRITFPDELPDAVKGKVASGEYPSEAEVILDGLRALMARDRAVSAKQVRARLAAEHKKVTSWSALVPSRSCVSRCSYHQIVE